MLVKLGKQSSKEKTLFFNMFFNNKKMQFSPCFLLFGSIQVASIISLGCFSFLITLQMNENKNGRLHIKLKPSKKKLGQLVTAT